MRKEWLPKIIFSLLLSISMSSQVDAAFNCQAAMAGLFKADSKFISWVSRTSRKPVNDIVYKKFSDLKSEYKARIDQGNDLNSIFLDSYESKLALFEASSEAAGFDVLQLSNILENGSEKDKRNLQKILTKIDLNKGISAVQAKDLVTSLYMISNSKSKGITGFFKEMNPSDIKNILQQRIEIEIASQDLLSAINKLGLVRSPQLLERLRAWRHQQQNIEEGIIAVALNTPSVIFAGFPIYFPKFVGVTPEKLPAEIISKIRTDGFDSAYPDIKKYFGNKVRFDAYWNVSRKA